ncbi:putative ribosomal RNA small subunit methyltransferase G [Selenomonas ruminantium subsp. lactilytica TAM6421]|uniref:Ribosomal RNA small subunit methyltransferase G n=1 Tax=Selenomonas ruminantium subsp. lactilytica (strain NBRC 103574 / TAM6421) TaxID=927704 RepID=I0GUU0_SELRL|nr:16S rRNA (guanine(527)-N(7))-methyltransferase RsmG [Selenomonas ruminantium]BAL84527.1 putative ribosomal RNA small subunit methyltransferase G [Selenomonas ruminantium subsp. lactilytica TAM6421]
MFKEELQRAAVEYGIELNDKQMEQFNRYFELLVEWNEKINLTAITEPKEVAIKHMIDSITAYDEALFKDGTTVIDVGTGAGFPGLPLKIFCPEIKLTLMDSLNKRIKFLQTVVEELGLKDVECVHARAEEGARNKKYRESFDIAVSRAVARLPILCEYCLPFVKKGGHFIALKGMQFQEEAEEAAKAIKVMGGSKTEIRPVKLPELDDKRAVITITKTMPTPKAYPRKAGTPTKNPIC